MKFLEREVRIREDVACQRSASGLEVPPDTKQRTFKSGTLVTQDAREIDDENTSDTEFVEERPLTVTATKPLSYCVLCRREGHWSSTCPEWISLSVNKRRTRANQENRCYLCLKIDHHSAVSKST